MLKRRVAHRAAALITIMMATVLVALATAGLSGTALAATSPGQTAVTTAYAAPATPASGSAHTAAQSPLARTLPDTNVATCTASRVNWVHIDFRYKNLCFGFKGTVKFSNAEMFQFCSGNNHGSFVYEWNGRDHTVNFGAGYRRDYPNNLYLIRLTITGWSGSLRC